MINAFDTDEWGKIPFQNSCKISKFLYIYIYKGLQCALTVITIMAVNYCTWDTGSTFTHCLDCIVKSPECSNCEQWAMHSAKSERIYIYVFCVPDWISNAFWALCDHVERHGTSIPWSFWGIFLQQKDIFHGTLRCRVRRLRNSNKFLFCSSSESDTLKTNSKIRVGEQYLICDINMYAK